MNGTTLFQTNPSTHNNSLDRPPPLRTSTTSTNGFGKNAWSPRRALWHGNNTGASRTGDNPADRPTTLQQESNSSMHFAKPSNRSALTPIENPRGFAKPNGNLWSDTTISSLNTRQEDQLISPMKQKHQDWSFSGDLDFGSENSGLLLGSAPDIDPIDEPTARNGFQVDERPHYTAQNMGNGQYSFDSQKRMLGSSINPKAFSTSSTIHTRLGSIRPSNGVSFSTDTAPTSLQFGTASTHASDAPFTSPTSIKFGRGQYREPYSNGAQQRDSSRIDDSIDSIRSLTLNGHTPKTQSSRSGSDPFGNSEYGQLQGNQLGVHGATPYLRLSVEHADFKPSGFSSHIDIADDSSLSTQYPSMWAFGGRGTPYSSEFRNNVHGPYYSAGATPPTGPESGRSASGSGLSSRTSQHELSVMDRKQGNLDAFQHSPFYQGGGLVPVNSPGYDFSLTPSNRMIPLAGTYTPYGLSGFSVSSIGGYSPTPRIPLREQEPQVIRSPLLEDFRMNSKTNKRYELRDIFNHVVEFSGDQHGSRFIQQKLETANSDEKDQVFKEIQTNCLQLMTDVFGNYVIQKLFEHGNQSQKKVLANHMKGHVLTLSMQMYGCRVVQKALEHVLTDQQASMVKELDGPNKQILKIIRDQNGNHVVQKAIERVPAEHIHFIIEAHRGEVVKLATHTYGCRVIQRILENCQPAAKRIILDELHGCVAPLITDSFGNYVVQHIIEKGEPEDRRAVVSIVQQQILNFSKHKFASNVVEKCIMNADEDQRSEIFRRLTGPNDQGQIPVLGLLRDQYGNYVIQKVHSLLKGAELEGLVNEMKLCLPQLKRTSYGKQVMAIEKLLFGMNNAASASTASRSSILPATSPGRNNNFGAPPQLHTSQHTFQQGLPAIPVLNTFSPH